jgi:hypothetical protein
MNQRFPCLGIDYYLNRILRFENWRAPVVPTLSKSFCAPPSNDNFIHPFHTNNATAIRLFLPFVIFHLPREGSMKLCFGCNQSFFCISKHRHHNSTCRSPHHERAQFVAAQQQSMLTNELSEGNDASSERRSKSLGSKSESDVAFLARLFLVPTSVPPTVLATMNCQKAMTLPLKEEASHLDPKVKVTWRSWRDYSWSQQASRQQY